MAGMVVPLVLFVGLLGVVLTCWYYRRRNSKAINIWVDPDEKLEDQGKRDKTRIGEGEQDEISSSGGGYSNNLMRDDIAKEKRRQKQSLLDAQQYTVQGQQMFDNTPMVIGGPHTEHLGIGKPSRNMHAGDINLDRNGSQIQMQPNSDFNSPDKIGSMFPPINPQKGDKA